MYEYTIFAVRQSLQDVRLHPCSHISVHLQSSQFCCHCPCSHMSDPLKKLSCFLLSRYGVHS
jgi:hypothetical protein